MIEIMKNHYNSYFNEIFILNLEEEAKGIMKKTIEKKEDKNDKNDDQSKIPRKLTMKEQFDINFIISLTQSLKNMSLEISATKYINFRNVHSIANDGGFIDESYMTFGTKFAGQIYSVSMAQLDFSRGKYDCKLSITETTTVDCIISSAALGVGSFKSCYLLKTIEVDKDATTYVAKISMEPVLVKEKFNADFETYCFASYFRNHFNRILSSIDGKKDKHIVLLPVVAIKYISGNNSILRGSKFILGQKCLYGDYTKFNNNYGWVKKNLDENTKRYSDIAQAYSHFTYEFSMGTMIVVDIQGTIENEVLNLTDPAIHSIIYEDKFGDTNHHKLGIIRFFQTHICNEYCKKLKLLDIGQIKEGSLDKLLEMYKGHENLNHLSKPFKDNRDENLKKIINFDPTKEIKILPMNIEKEEEFDSTVDKNEENNSRS